MKLRYWGILLFTFVLSGLHAQTCFYIESILADACGDPEGENEMVRIRTNVDIDINDLVFDWPNNNFLGWCPNPGTTAQLNQTITSSCGLLLEPTNGIVPANETLLVISSTNVLIGANSFQNLNDTLYIIYQCAGNTNGHFSNTANSPRTLQVSYNSSWCFSAQSVSYTATNLPGGDGGAIAYDTTGSATYFNTGCNAIVPALNPFWNVSSEICSDYGQIDLNSLLSNNATLGGSWSGDVENGNFFNTAGKFGNYTITYTVQGNNACQSSADSTISFFVRDPGFGRDTIERCDSIRQFGVLITSDTLINITVQNPNPFACDSVVERFYKINTLDVVLEPSAVTLVSGSSFEFSLNPPITNFTIWNSFNADTCFFPCTLSELSPEEEGTYTFLIEDPVNSCSDFRTIEVQLIYNSELNIPTAFTPNNDGVNDLYKLYGQDLNFLEFQIFSRWGELLFQGNSLDDTWDGTFKGKEVESALFLIHIKAAGKDGKRYETTRKIKLIR